MDFATISRPVPCFSFCLGHDHECLIVVLPQPCRKSFQKHKNQSEQLHFVPDMFNPKMYKELCILCCAVQHITGLAEKSFVKVRVPDGHFIPSEGQPRPLHGPKTDCAFNCAMDGECEAYLVEGNLCSTGVMNMSNPYVPSFVSAGKNVMVETHKVFFNTFSIPFSGHLEAVESTGKALTNGTILSPLTFKPYPYKATGKKVFGNTGYKGGLIVCGGLNNGVTVKTCSFWTFASAKWTMMEGELANGHFAGRLVVVQDRLWMFMGSQDEAGAPYKKVESYDLKLGRWREEPDANVVYGAQYFEAVVFDQTKVSNCNHETFIFSFFSCVRCLK